MKILILNLGLYGSTGNIVLEIKNKAEASGHSVRLAYPEVVCNKEGFEDDIILKGWFSRKVNHLIEKITGRPNCYSFVETIWLCNQIKRFSPDLINIHAIHQININLGMLFRFLKQINIPVVWTFHDCWAFTGQCVHFDYVGCQKWKTGCSECSQYKNYPDTYIDNTSYMWKQKRKWFNGVNNMTIVTPSQWLGELVKHSFLGNYPVKVINNGINLNLFKYTDSKLRTKLNIGDRFVILGVSADWAERKGLTHFVRLAEELDDRFRIILIGLEEQQKVGIPDNIITIEKTTDQCELAQYYSMADVFMNPTREDNYPTVNMEAIACGTPVITFMTGGSPEMIDSETGIVLMKDDYESLKQSIIDMGNGKIVFFKDKIVEKSYQFDMNDKFMKYVELFEGLAN